MNQPSVEIYRQLRGLMGRMRTQQRLIECIRDNAEHTAPNLSGTPRGSLPWTMADSVSLLVDLERGMEQLRAEYAALLERVRPHIERLPEKYKAVMHMRYEERKSVNRIACGLYYTRQWVYQLLRQAENS